tara:strand:+ start:1532 stop:2674 length:1143 start_codon:yes stop_codon:yes gene_type:complete
MTSKKVRIFNIKYSQKDKEVINEYFNQVLEEAFLTNHTFCRKLEAAHNDIYQPYASIACSSATAGLEAVFRYINVKSKAVLVQANTFIATSHAIQAAGGVIVPFDLDDNYVASYKDIQLAYDKCQEDGIEVKAVCVVNISGRGSKDLLDIYDFCNSKGIKLVEDNAQGMLSILKNKPLGTFSDFSIDSFQTTKVVACGEGGMIHAKDKTDFELLKNMIFYGKSKEQPLFFDRVSGNFKLSELNAALALADLERSEPRIKRRREIDEMYNKNVCSIHFRHLDNPEDNLPSNYKTIFIAKNKEIRSLIEKDFKTNGIGMTGYVYKIPINQQPRVISSDKFIQRDLPNTLKFCNTHFTPPNYPELTNEEIEYVSDKLNKFSIK